MNKYVKEYAKHLLSLQPETLNIVLKEYSGEEVQPQGVQCPQPKPTTKPTPNGEWACKNGEWVWIAGLG